MGEISGCISKMLTEIIPFPYPQWHAIHPGAKSVPMAIRIIVSKPYLPCSSSGRPWPVYVGILPTSGSQKLIHPDVEMV